MTHTRVSEVFSTLAAGMFKSTRMLALAIIAAFMSLAMQPAQAQTSDTWKSVAIIGGSTAAGAYIGHKVAGPTGAVIGAGLGATAGYEIDQRRRANEYYNQASYGDGGNYGSNDGGYYGNNNPYYGNGNGGYNGDPYGGAYPYPSGYQSSNYYTNRSSNRH